MPKNRTYACIDLKSFYASVECRERGLDPLATNLVVADPERTQQTICLAVSPSMKALGVPGRCRVFEIPPHIPYIMATPRMQLYMDYSAEIYGVYLKYLAKEDLYPYSIDEVFLDMTEYLSMYQMTAEELCQAIMADVLCSIGIPSAAGIGANLYLAKIALDITAKHMPVTSKSNHGAPIGVLDEETYRKTLWDHRPLTDFWRIGAGTAKRLERMGITTMRGVAKAEEESLYQLFGIDAELLIDHAWGREPTTIADIKAYKPKNNSLSSSQALGMDYAFEDGKLLVKEMADLLCLELVDQRLATDSVTLHVGYSSRLGKKPAHRTASLHTATSSAKQIISAALRLYEQIVDPYAPIRRINISFNRVIEEGFQQYSLFDDPAELERERRMQEALLDIKKKFGKNAVLKGMSLLEKSTARERNRQIGGHKSGET